MWKGTTDSLKAKPTKIKTMPKKSREKTIYRDVIESEIKDQFPSYYFDKLHKKSKRQKYSGLPIEVQNSLLRLEQEGKKS